MLRVVHCREPLSGSKHGGCHPYGSSVCIAFMSMTAGYALPLMLTGYAKKHSPKNEERQSPVLIIQSLYSPVQLLWARWFILPGLYHAAVTDFTEYCLY